MAFIFINILLKAGINSISFTFRAFPAGKDALKDTGTSE